MIKNQNNQTNKTRKILLKKTTRQIILLTLSILLLISLIATILAYQTPTTTQETTKVAEYQQTSSYTYLVYLKNNTLYEMPLLLPNQGIYFKQIIDNITASITYTYQSDVPGTISGNYSIYAEIKTDLWTKKYPLTNQTSFTNTDQTMTFTKEFPINYSFYDDAVEQINKETGTTAPNPIVILHTNIRLTQTTPQGNIHAQFSPELTMTLTQKTIELSENLTSRQTGALTRQTTLYHESVLLQRNILTIITFSFTILFGVLFLVTTTISEQKTETEKIIKKIYKRNGEWIHKTTTPPPTALQHLLRFSSIEDIIKISEDLNKPLLHYIASNPTRHLFYVLDATTTYLFELES